MFPKKFTALPLLNSICEKRHQTARLNLEPFFSKPRPASLEDGLGRRTAIVVGNGPSLRSQSPEDLPSGTFFLCNNAHRLPEKWRLVSQDLVIGDPDPDWLPEVVLAGTAMQSGSTIYVSSKTPLEMPPSWDKARVVRTRVQHRLLDNYGYPKSKGDLGIPRDEFDLYKYRHTPMLAIQIALLQGYERIVLAGLDHDHVIRVLTSEIAHVDHAYAEAVTEQEIIPRRTYLALAEEVRATWGMYAALNNLAHLMGAEIIDATAGGQLDVFPKALLL